MNKLKAFIIILFISFLEISSAIGGTHQEEGLRNLIERANAQDAKALYQLARLYDSGFEGIPVDSIKSTALYLQSAKKGYPPAMNYLGFRYYKGEIVKQNIDSALYWIQSAADKGDITAATNLGYLLTEGEGIEHDDKEAAKWLAFASESGVKEAQSKLLELMGETWKELPPDSALTLGLKYYKGKAPIIGTYLLERASEANLPKAKALLGDAYSKGLGVPYNHQKALEYFYSAAVSGDPSAQFIIGELLEFFPDTFNGMKEITDELKYPQYWYSKARENGVTDSETANRKLFSLP